MEGVMIVLLPLYLLWQDIRLRHYVKRHPA